MTGIARRELPNWIDSYMEYTDHTESATVYHKWVAIYLISSCLQRKTWFRLGMFDIHTNLYVIIAGPPGRGRKTKALSIGKKLLKGLPEFQLGPTVVASKEALYMALEKRVMESYIPPSEKYPSGVIKHCSIPFISDEFETFLGQKGDNNKFVAQLTDYYDCADDFQYEAKISKGNNITNIWVSILAATTPTSLSQAFPITAIGSGFGRRLLFIWAHDKSKSVPIPGSDDTRLKDTLIRDLSRINQISGEVTFTDRAKEWWINWYNGYDFNSPDRLCLNQNFTGWYSVKPDLVIKVAMCMAASERNMVDINVQDFERAIAEIEDIEPEMEFALQSIGKSNVSDDIIKIEEIVKKHGKISEEKLFLLIWQDVDQKAFDNIFPTMEKKGTVKRVFTQDGGTYRTFYKWNK